MYSSFDKLKFSTNHPLWNWGIRHAGWIRNGYFPQKGMTPYELVYGKGDSSSFCQFGEPVFGYAVGPDKGDARWKRMIISYKIRAQSVNNRRAAARDVSNSTMAQPRAAPAQPPGPHQQLALCPLARRRGGQTDPRS
jgi:hypothetical protein